MKRFRNICLALLAAYLLYRAYGVLTGKERRDTDDSEEYSEELAGFEDDMDPDD